VASVFGIGSIRVEKRLDLVATLKDWKKWRRSIGSALIGKFYEVLGLQCRT